MIDIYGRDPSKSRQPRVSPLTADEEKQLETGRYEVARLRAEAAMVEDVMTRIILWEPDHGQ